LALSSASDSEDDGWCDEDDVGSETAVKKALLQSLQEDRQKQQTVPLIDSRPEGQQPEEQERDLFIPIFPIVLLVRLFDAYGYKILGLAARGELYLPWTFQ
jgi:hypothetical protein